MGRGVRLQDQARQSETPVAIEVGEADAARGGKSLVVLERLPNLLVPRRRGDVVSRQPDYSPGVSQSGMTWIRICEEFQAKGIDVDDLCTLRGRIAVKGRSRGLCIHSGYPEVPAIREWARRRIYFFKSSYGQTNCPR